MVAVKNPRELLPRLDRKYTYEQAYEASLEYFFGNELATKVFLDKYSLRDKDGNYRELTPDDMHKRLAYQFARIDSEKYGLDLEERYDVYYEAIRLFERIVPQGSPMAAVGNPFQVMSCSNCVVVASPEDSIEGIMRTGEELAQLWKRRAGCGVDVSTLRPEGMKVNNAARTTNGAWSFCDFYSYICRMVAASGRRGALILTMDVHHPDIAKFITMKLDKQKVTGANVSVRYSDEFMKAVCNDTVYEQRWPLQGTPKIRRMVRARDIWDLAVKCATESAEPGCIFWDTMCNYLPAHSYPAFKTQSTNPCQPGWATVLTPDGISTFNQIEIDDIIWSGTNWTKITNKVCTGVKRVYAFRTRAGSFYGTEDHYVIQRGKRLQARLANTIDLSVCEVPTTTIKPDLQDVIDGLVVGDGMVHKASNNKVVLCIGKDDKYYHQSEIKNKILKHRPGIQDTAWEIETTVSYDELPRTFKRFVPDRFLYGSPLKKRGFLRGLYSANGSIVSTRITLKATSKAVVEQVQLMLSSLGIKSYHTVNKEHDVKFKNGTYTCKQSYDVNISVDRCRFRDLIGFIHPYKNESLDYICNRPTTGRYKKSYEIVEKELISEEPVYDITVEADEHTYWTGGLLVSNCAELPLSPYDSCRLISQNLTGYILDPFTSQARFNWNMFVSDVEIATQMSDNLVDLELECIERIRKVCGSKDEKALWKKFLDSGKNGRRIGLGTHGLGDTLAQLRIKYDSEEALKFVDKLYSTFRDTAYMTSVSLAQQRGAFPAWDWETEKDNLYINRLPKHVKGDIRAVGRRNISLLTQAPTGSVSICSRTGPTFNRYGTSSGVEPVYMNSYTRRRKLSDSDDGIRVDFVDELGDKWQHYKVSHGNVQNYLDTVEGDVSRLPSYFVQAGDIDWQFRVRLQGVEQKYLDHSVSSTLNLPKGTKPDTVGGIYLEAWKHDLKGVTVYVDGSRDGVLVSSTGNGIDPTKRPEEIIRMQAPKRPKELECDIHHTQVKGRRYVALVGLLDGEPYEFFGGYPEAMSVPKKYKKGKIIKRAKGKYRLHIGKNGDSIIIDDIAKILSTPEMGWTTRLISVALRHGTPLQFLVRQLSKGGGILDFNKVVSRVLKKYIKNGQKVKSSRVCVECKGPNLVYQEGCPKCLDCGFTQCG